MRSKAIITQINIVSKFLVTIAIAWMCALPALTQKSGLELRQTSYVLDAIGRAAGITVFADSTIARELAPMPATGTTITPDTIEKFIDGVIKHVGRDAKWILLYLPPPPKGKIWKADEIIALAQAQAKLYGTVGAKPPTGFVEIFSNLVPVEKAKSAIELLNLKPVYVVGFARGNFAGTWTTTYGEMKLTQQKSRVTGTYTTGDGRIEGTVTGTVFRFRWIEASGSQGEGWFQLADDAMSFSGRWNTTNSDPPGTFPSVWTGQRIAN